MINNRCLLILLVSLFVVPQAQAETLDSPYSTTLKKKLASALKEKPATYQPRTRHLCKNGEPCYTNRLILEDSPYLIQHAHNPVNWFPWSDEALTKARKENKIIIMSIGYSTCHWCHVMEKESFDDLEIARILNKDFIVIKIDKEQRPDIDEYYGDVSMLTSGQRGWPTTIFLTPDGKPFFGGTYYPKQEFKELLLNITSSWKNQSNNVIARAEGIANNLREINKIQGSVKKINRDNWKKAVKQILSIYDSFYGGFGDAAKFPNETWLSLILDSITHYDDKEYLSTVFNNTLVHMARGGIYDHVGGGFHRYSTDPYWNTPHYEKMLYNQALLSKNYIDGYHVFSNPLFLIIAEQTLDYVIGNLQSPTGAFYSAVDADSGIKDEEGSYYIWHFDEIKKILNANELTIFTELYSVNKDNQNHVLYLNQLPTEYATENNLPRERILKSVEKIRQKLQKTQQLRVPPAIDRKIIMGWNALMITALAEGARSTGNINYMSAATNAAEFIWTKMRNKDGFYRIYYNERASIPAQLRDYACYLQSLITLYDIQGDSRWLNRAEILAGIMMSNFWDKKEGGFFDPPDQKGSDIALPIRPKSAIDKTLPSGNAVAAQSLLRLARRTADLEYIKRAKNIITTFSSDIEQQPSAYSSLLVATQEYFHGEKTTPVYSGNGKIKVVAKYKHIQDNEYRLTVEIALQDKWHINSHLPFEKNLIPVKIELVKFDKIPGWKIDNIKYPEGESVTLGFSSKPLSVYQGHVTITARLYKEKGNLISPFIQLKLQPCNDRVCLLPETFRFFPDTTDRL